MFRLFEGKIAKTRKNLKDPKFLRETYLELLKEDKRMENFEKFKCSDFFEGKRKAAHNRIVLSEREKRNERKLKFIINLIKELDTRYYLKYIGTLTEDEKIKYFRNNKLNKLLDGNI